MKRSLIFACAAAFMLAGAGNALAANGDNLRTIIADRTGTACASVNAQGDHSSVGVGIAYDGTNLLISCYSDNTVTAINPANGAQVAIHNIIGASSLGALAWDNGRGLMWACSNFGTVGTINLTTNVFTPAFPASGTGCFDGLAYDASDDTIWASGDVVQSIEHYSITGTLLSSNPVSLGCGSSGIGVGGPLLYLANNGCSQIYTSPKDFSSPPTLFATFNRRLEDLECDNLSFAPAGAMWSIDAYDNILNAWEIPAGSCSFGGGGPPPDETDPSCVLFATNAGPPKSLTIAVQDGGSGLASVTVLTSTNATTVVPAFTAGTTSTVYVESTKNDQAQGSVVALRVTDVAGNSVDCDPVWPGKKKSTHWAERLKLKRLAHILRPS